ncbi:hypothetical protein SADUNF_Sadunf02G0069400 [Salix dunnii]|uniref:Uncharacterized protein n=1 Tax=Salix dunnii TaxID=1413687 RepID=A0A835N6R6_9ROSI|nr:hypothetical protein SADUNF_Sadunf02G0069400 [Salix dunnii]
MAPPSIYHYHMRQDFNTNVDNNNSTATPMTDALNIHLQFNHVLELCYPETIQIPLNTTIESHLFPRRLFLSHVNRENIIKEILSSMGCSPDFVESVAPDISSFALDMVTDPCNASSGEALTMVLAIFVTTPYDEREEIDRALSDSLMQETSRFKPASKSCIDGLKRMSLEGSCSMKECMICLEEFLMGSEGKPKDTLHNTRKTTEAAAKESMIIRTIEVVPATKSLRVRLFGKVPVVDSSCNESTRPASSLVQIMSLMEKMKFGGYLIPSMGFREEDPAIIMETTTDAAADSVSLSLGFFALLLHFTVL